MPPVSSMVKMTTAKMKNMGQVILGTFTNRRRRLKVRSTMAMVRLTNTMACPMGGRITIKNRTMGDPRAKSMIS